MVCCNFIAFMIPIFTDIYRYSPIFTDILCVFPMFPDIYRYFPKFHGRSLNRQISVNIGKYRQHLYKLKSENIGKYRQHLYKLKSENIGKYREISGNIDSICGSRKISANIRKTLLQSVEIKIGKYR